MQSELAKNIFKAARKGDKNTISRLLPDATEEELKYEEKVCIVQCCLYFLCDISSNHLSNYKIGCMFNVCALYIYYLNHHYCIV